MSAVIKLVGLQDLEIEIAAFEKAIADARSKLGESQALRKARDDAKTAENTCRELNSRQKDLELQSEELDSKLKNVNDKLYSGRVTNPKELTNLQQEASMLSVKVAKIDEETLNVIENSEKAGRESERALALLKQEENSNRLNQLKLNEDINIMNQKLSSLQEKRVQMVDQIPPQMLQQYERIKMQKGVAVARVDHGTCGGCRISLSTSQLQRARSDSLERCANCGRILFSE